MNKRIYRFIVTGFFLFVFGLQDVIAQPAESSSSRRLKRHPDFHIPAAMRARVDYWIDVFTKYGKHNAVLHHRNFPQIVFRVLDFSSKATSMSKVSLEKYRKNSIKRHSNEIYKAMKKLATGAAPSTELEKRIENRMAFLGRSNSKYKKVYQEKWVRSQRGIREKYAEAIKRSGRYMHILEKVFVQDYGLPIELTRLPFVESSFDYKAYSSVGAAGIWQFMRRTGRVYKMTINNLVDERRDVITSTRGAAEYLRDAYQTLGTWPLALTSYNHGVNGVSRKVKKLGTKNIVKIIESRNEQLFGFASQNFYPEFLAALDIYDRPEFYFPNVRPESPLRLAQRKLPHSVSVKYLKDSIGIDLETLKSVNYAVSSKVWRGSYRIPKGYVLKVPASYGQRLASVSIKASSPPAQGASSIYGGVVYKVRRGDTLSRIARRYRTNVAKLRQYNNLSGDLLRVGQMIVVKPREDAPTVSGSGGGHSAVASSYRVRRGDTLSVIAGRHGTSVRQIQGANGLSSTRIRIGQVLKIPGRGGGGSASVTENYVVRRGDSLWSISKRFGVSMSSIKKTNGLRSSSLRVGQKLRIKR